MRIKTIPTSIVLGLETNCYLVIDEVSREALVIDPGGSPQAILERIAQLNAQVKLVVNTHGHFDHIAADREVLDATGAELAAHRDALPLFQGDGSAGLFGVHLPKPPLPTRLLEDGDLLTIGEETFTVLHTPGHTPGCISLYNEKQAVVFDGDLLFNAGVGRSDLPGGDGKLLGRSIREKILTLPDATVVYPGHGPSTRVGRERRSNPYLSYL